MFCFDYFSWNFYMDISSFEKTHKQKSSLFPNLSKQMTTFINFYKYARLFLKKIYRKCVYVVYFCKILTRIKSSFNFFSQSNILGELSIWVHIHLLFKVLLNFPLRGRVLVYLNILMSTEIWILFHINIHTFHVAMKIHANTSTSPVPGQLSVGELCLKAVHSAAKRGVGPFT